MPNNVLPRTTEWWMLYASIVGQMAKCHMYNSTQYNEPVTAPINDSRMIEAVQIANQAFRLATSNAPPLDIHPYSALPGILGGSGPSRVASTAATESHDVCIAGEWYGVKGAK